LLQADDVGLLAPAHLHKALRQVSQLVAASHLERMIVIASLHLVRAAHQALERAQDLFAERPAREQCDHDRQCREQEHVLLHLVEEGRFGIERALHHVELGRRGVGPGMRRTSVR
jgi:hypothetical protein